MQSPLPVFALLCNAFLWGLSWWPFRQMQAAGLHPLWATALMYTLVCAVMLVVRPGSLRELLAQPALWLLALNSGVNNMAFNWAVTVGDVVRVVLVFYLMPAWLVLLAWRILGERPTPQALARLALAFGGLALVLVPAGTTPGRLLAHLSLADGLALLGGFTFAVTNVLLRRLHTVPGQARMLAMFAGCMLLGWMSALAGEALGAVPAFPAFDLRWAALAAVLALLLMFGNWALQYGAARLPTAITGVVMLSEVLFASVSSVLLGAAELHARTVAGGALIVLAALWATLQRR
ncbi:MAG: DMT family transporter [Proteobacteria bacterium]|nr:DMT family transporter [Pseudomonadota bacterium]MBS0611483.1 DMT family transporter [Pseudomonadota bacterium]